MAVYVPVTWLPSPAPSSTEKVPHVTEPRSIAIIGEPKATELPGVNVSGSDRVK